MSNENAWVLPPFALNELFFALFTKKKPALLLTNKNGEIFPCILLVIDKVIRYSPLKNTRMLLGLLNCSSKIGCRTDLCYIKLEFDN